MKRQMTHPCRSNEQQQQRQEQQKRDARQHRRPMPQCIKDRLDARDEQQQQRQEQQKGEMEFIASPPASQELLSEDLSEDVSAGYEEKGEKEKDAQKVQVVMPLHGQHRRPMPQRIKDRLDARDKVAYAKAYKTKMKSRTKFHEAASRRPVAIVAGIAATPTRALIPASPPLPLAIQVDLEHAVHHVVN
jgi:hypothetical protein